MKKALIFSFLFLTITPFFAQIPAYYNGLDLTKTGNELFLELAGRVESTHSGIPYTSSSTTDVWDACDQADEDPDIDTNVLLIYGFDDTDGDESTDRTRVKTLHDTGNGDTGVWNREHIFAKSLANPSLVAESGEITPGSDVHNLRAADRTRNSSRSNRKFADGSGNSDIVSSNGGWYPGDEWKGDVARTIMYMYLRYHGDGSQSSQTSCLPINIGFGSVNAMDPNMIDLFLTWNAEDPVSDFEANRNEILSGIQLNRNPFIDNPYLATIIWGGLNAEDKWNMGSSSDTEAPTAPSNLVSTSVTDESINISWTASTDNIAVYDYLIYLDDVYLQTSNTTTAIIANLSPNTAYNITVKARDAASNLSEFSNKLTVTTETGPFLLFSEDFNDCASVQFFAYSEASNKDWICESQFGENSSGSYGINGYQEVVLSKDWLITTNAIDFDINEDELLSFYTDAAYGSSSLVLVYSSDYDGSGDPTNFTWVNVPNLSIPTHSDGSGTEEVYKFNDVDISSITGAVYFAFKYYSNGSPTRWTVDNFEITATEPSDDTDNDGVLNTDDLCPNTPVGETVDVNGCSNGQLDDDNDGVQNSDDLCASTPTGETVNSDGCSDSQLDDDNDGVMNNVDLCADTPTGETVDVNGCSNGQLDDDNDGVINSLDLCADTPTGETVNSDGCSDSQLDDDNDGVMNNVDLCADTPTGETVDANGCWDGQLDDDNDGVMNNVDDCPTSTSGTQVNSAGCFILPSSNFVVETIGETCTGENNGQVVITANENYNYSFSINNVDYSFTNAITVEGLEPGNYEFCIAVVGQNYEQCFNIVIEAAQEISGKASVSANSVSIEIIEGTAPYLVSRNGIVIDKTSLNVIEIENINQGDLIEVKSKIACEGTFSKIIDLFSEYIAFPNPSKGSFEVGVPAVVDKELIQVEVYNSQLLLISSKLYNVNYGRININLENQPTGVYFIKVYGTNTELIRVIKE
ncbi:Endonuclease I [Lutibacter oricola]|uniref:Endonuclease I n=1 Tax=Lutibacter oricola TaxID=762486 RepID=A0A1H3G296_9FLAO|nr:endonuclease [Lutibacter oricola]SDX97462.1 Endonuclease I [Lutibacter oricola]